MALWSPLIDRLGGNAVVAAYCGIKPSVVSHWRRRGVPARFWAEVVALAEARGVAGVSLDTVRRALWQRESGGSHDRHDSDTPPKAAYHAIANVIKSSEVP